MKRTVVIFWNRTFQMFEEEAFPPHWLWQDIRAHFAPDTVIMGVLWGVYCPEWREFGI